MKQWVNGEMDAGRLPSSTATMTRTYCSVFSRSSTSTWYFLESNSISYACRSRNSQTNWLQDITDQRLTSASRTFRHSSGQLMFENSQNRKPPNLNFPKHLLI